MKRNIIILTAIVFILSFIIAMFPIMAALEHNPQDLYCDKSVSSLDSVLVVNSSIWESAGQPCKITYSTIKMLLIALTIIFIPLWLLSFAIYKVNYNPKNKNNQHNKETK